MPLNETLQRVEGVFTALHDVLMEENGLLRHTQQPPDEAFLEKKQTMLIAFEEAIIALKSIERVGHSFKAQLTALEQKLMKALGLLRENEQLLLNGPMQAIHGTSLGASTPCAPGQAQRLAKLYNASVIRS